MNNRRAAGLGLLAYGVGTAAAFSFNLSPGGEYHEADVSGYVASSFWPTAFVLAYLGAIATLGLLVFGQRMRTELGAVGDTVWALTIAAAATGVIGWTVVAGVDVAFAEGGSVVQDGVAHPVVFMFTQIGNLLAICSPAFFVGAAAIVLAAKAPLPGWLRVASYLAGLCGILAALFLTWFLFILWTIAFGVWAAVSTARTEPAAMQKSLV